MTKYHAVKILGINCNLISLLKTFEQYMTYYMLKSLANLVNDVFEGVKHLSVMSKYQEFVICFQQVQDVFA